MVMGFKRYLTYFFTILITLLLCIGGFNTLIDPFARYQWLTLAGINAEKTQVAITGVRTLKAMMLAQGHYQALILGTSRANVGLDPKHPLLTEATYNAALDGSNIYELEKVFDFAIRHNPELKLMIIALDFLTFSNQRTVNADFAQSRFAAKPSWWTQLGHTLSVDESYYAIKTLWDNQSQRQAAYQAIYTPNGLAKRRFPATPRRLFRQILTQNFLVNRYTYAGFCYSMDRLARLRRMLATAERHHITVKLFISPIHAWLLETIRIMGLYPTYTQWQRDLTQLLPLWDFSGYNAFTTETVTANQPMRWYWDASHYRRALGDIILTQLLTAQGPSDFGVLIQQTNIEAHLQHQRQAQQRYQQRHAQDIALLERLAQHHRRHYSCPHAQS